MTAVRTGPAGTGVRTEPVGGRRTDGVLGIDLGGTKAALRAEHADGSGRVEEAVLRWPRNSGAAADWTALAADVRNLADRWGGGFAAVGVAVPATLDPSGTVTAWPGRPAWTGFGLDAALRGLFPGIRVRRADDGDLAALAESVHAGCGDVAYLGVGTGVGGGLVRAGRLFPGPGRGSCEVGHMITDREGPRCDCGRRGCLQATASGPATLRRAAELRGAEVDFDTLRDALAADAGWAVRALDDTCAALAAAVVTLGELAHPDIAVIGGGFAAALPSFTARVDAHVRRLARPGTAPVPVAPARLGALSSLHGALALAREVLPGTPHPPPARPAGAAPAHPAAQGTRPPSDLQEEDVR